MTMLDDLKDYLTSADTAAELLGLLLLGRRSDLPVEQVTLIETPGMAGEKVFNSALLILERPRLQVTSRGVAYVDAWNRMRLVEELLERCGPRTINGVFYHTIEPVQPPFLLEYDPLDRPILCQNFEVQKQRSPHARTVAATDTAVVLLDEGGGT